MGKWRSLAPDPETSLLPVELLDDDHAIWKSSDSTRLWLERHRLVRRLRPSGDIADMTAAERRGHALNLWRERRPTNLKQPQESHD